MLARNDLAAGGPAAHLGNLVIPAPCASPTGCHTLCSQCRVRMLAVCSALNDEDIKDLEAIAEHRNYDPRRTLFRESDRSDAVYSITSGTIRLQNDLEDGRRQIVGFALPGDFMGLALADTCGFTAEAITPVSVCRFDRAAYVRLVENRPQLLRRLHEVASHELGIAQQHMMVLGRRKAEERVAAFLVRWKERIAHLQGDSATVPLPMGRQDIADHLGLTIETVSRVFARWMRERIILDVPDGIRVLDRERLRALAGE